MGILTGVTGTNELDLVAINAVTDSNLYFSRIVSGGRDGMRFTGNCFGNRIGWNVIGTMLGWGVNFDASGVVNDNLFQWGDINAQGSTSLGGINANRSSANRFYGVIENITTVGAPALELTDSSLNVIGVHFEANSGDDILFNVSGSRNKWNRIVSPSSFNDTKASPYYNINVPVSTTDSLSIDGLVHQNQARLIKATANGGGNAEFHIAYDAMPITASQVTDTTDFGIAWHRPLFTTFTYDPASIADGASLTSAGQTVTGALLGKGWRVEVSAPYDLQGLVCTGYISATDTVKVVLYNKTGGAIDLASGTWRVVVRRD